VFVTQDSPALGDDSLDGLARLIGPDQRLFATAEREFEVNWKILLEGFIEGYHIQVDASRELPALRLRQSERHRPVRPPQPRDLSVPAHQEAGQVPAQERRVEGLLTYVYHLFPTC